jgi:hypothetical protein
VESRLSNLFALDAVVAVAALPEQELEVAALPVQELEVAALPEQEAEVPEMSME